MMNFIRDNILKILLVFVLIIVIIIVVVACLPKGTVITKTDKAYSDMENRLQGAAIKLVDSNNKLLPKTIDQVRRIQLSTLINSGLIKELYAIENSSVACNGYVEVTKKEENENNYRYTPYVKCGKYYETKTIAEYIVENETAVTSGEGLYKVEVKQAATTNENEKKEEDKVEEKLYSYYFKGEYPNNYIMLGERLYRIMEITEDNYLKLISTNKTRSTYCWDDRFNSEDNKYSGINDFSKSRLKEYLYYAYSNMDDEGEIFFSNTERDYIVSHDFCVGKRSANDLNINSGTECEVKEKLKIGLITVQDYYKVSTASNCDSVGKQECNNYNYLYSISENSNIRYMTLTGNKDNTFTFFQIDDGDYKPVKCYSRRNFYPVVYIDKNILYQKGNGTKENPYIVR